MKSIGEVIYDHRTRQGLRIQDLANKSGISRPHISRIERDAAFPSRHYVEVLADALEVDDVTKEYLLDLHKSGYMPKKPTKRKITRVHNEHSGSRSRKVVRTPKKAEESLPEVVIKQSPAAKPAAAPVTDSEMDIRTVHLVCANLLAAGYVEAAQHILQTIQIKQN